MITLVYTTIDSQQAADELAIECLKAQLAACVNIVPQATSHYLWQGELQSSTEYLLLCKTSIQYVDELIALLQQHHPYDCPAILSASVDSTAEFERYVLDSTSAREQKTSK